MSIVSGSSLAGRVCVWFCAAFLVLASKEASGACPEIVFFGNGIDTPQQDAQWTATILRAHINVELLRQGRSRIDKDCVRSQYATDVGKIRGVINTVDQLSEQERFRTFWLALAGLTPESEENRPVLEDLLRQSINIQLDDPQTGPDLRRQLTDYWDAISVYHSKVIVVAHSQGNAFANASFDLLRAGFDHQHPAIDPAMFSIVAGGMCGEAIVGASREGVPQVH